MKKIFISLAVLISILAFFGSLNPTESEWHEGAAKLGVQSIYIKKDGSISVRLEGESVTRPPLNVFDSKSANVGLGSMNLYYKTYMQGSSLNERKLSDEELVKAKQSNPNQINKNQVFILDLREGAEYGSGYYEIIEKEVMNNSRNIK